MSIEVNEVKSLVTQEALEEMLDLWDVDEVSEPSGFVLVEDRIIDQRRWVTVKRRVVRTPEDRFFAFSYETPSTEMQDGSESPVTPNDVYEVFPHEVTTIVYKKTPQVK